MPGCPRACARPLRGAAASSVTQVGAWSLGFSWSRTQRSTPALEQPRGGLGVEQEVVDAQTGVPLPALAEVIPERVDALLRVQLAQRVGPALREQAPVALAALGLQQRVLEPRARVVDVEVRRHDVVVAREDHGSAARVELGRVLDQPLEPAQLVVELRSGLRVAVGQVEAPDDEVAHLGLDVAAVIVVGVAGQRATDLDGRGALRQDRDAVPGTLSVPDRVVARGADVEDREPLAHGLEFLQAGDVGLLALEPAEQVWQPGADAVHVEGGDLERRHRGLGPVNWRSNNALDCHRSSHRRIFNHYRVPSPRSP